MENLECAKIKTEGIAHHAERWRLQEFGFWSKCHGKQWRVLIRMLYLLTYFKKIYFIYLFLERGREGERGEKHQCVVAS